MKIPLALAAVAALVVFSPLALAQTSHPRQSADYAEQRVEGGTVVTFPGDQVQGEANDPYMGLVRRPPPVLRAGLIRPRMNFVQELLKSVENL